MRNKYTLKVYPAGMGRELYRVIELSGNDTLENKGIFIIPGLF